MSALARELEEARKRAGDAEEAAYALRMSLAASERDAAHAHAARRAAEVGRDVAQRVLADRDGVLQAVEAALPDCTGDLARDVAGLVATLREHESALARVTAERDDAIGGALWWRDSAHWHEKLSALVKAYAPGWAGQFAALQRAQRSEPAPQPEALQLCTPEAPEPPHAPKVGERVRIVEAQDGEAEAVGLCGTLMEVDASDVLLPFAVRADGDGARDWWWVRKVERLALAVGDPVHVRLGDREAVGTVTRSPADGTLEAWRVEADDGREVYAREADIERVAVKP